MPDYTARAAPLQVISEPRLDFASAACYVAKLKPIGKLRSLILDTDVANSAFLKVYSFTNENLRAYLPLFDLKDKDVLTVAASGDHALNIALQNPKSITCFDINKLTYYWLQFKKACLATMPLEDFKKFFFHDIIHNGLTIGEKYDEVKWALAPDAAYFWGEAKNVPLKSLFMKGHFLLWEKQPVIARKYYQQVNTYLDEEKYLELQKKIQNIDIDFINSDIFALPHKTDKKFDAVFTSNICAFITAELYKQYVEEQLPGIIKPRGSAQIVYNYDDKDIRNKTFEGPQYEKKLFNYLGAEPTKSSIVIKTMGARRLFKMGDSNIIWYAPPEKEALCE